jgi:SAM-dependent methyltransferase
VGDGVAGVEGLVSAPETAAPPAGPIAARSDCRLCGEPLRRTFADLGVSPLANAYVTEAELAGPETFFPLHAFVCEGCLLVQLPESESPEQIFRDYAYFSSVSESWVEHARRYADSVADRLGLGAESLVVELASNDGYLLQHLVARGVPVLGIEPARNVAAAAVERGIPTIAEFFGSELARRLVAEGRRADLVIGNNVLAHVPPVHDFVEGIRILLAPGGAAALEFPHLLRLIEERQFDTIYHEHFSYFSLLVVERLFAEHGLVVCDVEEQPTHGGSLRMFARHVEDESKPVESRVAELRERERAAGLERLETYDAFGEAVREVKRDLLSFLIEARRRGSSVVAYGAAAKGNTLLNYCGVGSDLVDYVVDRSPHKQGLYLPGTRLPIHPPERVAETRPDYLLVLPWNLVDEIAEQMAHVLEWGCQLVVPVPRVRVL